MDNNNQHWSEIDIIEHIKEHGYLVIPNYISSEVAEIMAEEAIEWLIDHFPLTDDHETWKHKNMPFGPRLGMMQSLISSTTTAWECRRLMRPIFEHIWDETDLLTSIDGATIFPPRHVNKGRDWHHIDQISKGFKCIQGQLVLTNTSASFKCVKKSNKIHDELIDEYCENSKSNFNFFSSNEMVDILDKYSLPPNDPIHVGAGSVILWDSRTIHSAQRENGPTEYYTGDSLDGWRCTFYVCMRPRVQYSKRNLNTLRRAGLEHRTTNHWGTRIFPKYPRYESGFSHEVIHNIDNTNELGFCGVPDEFVV